MRFLPFLGLLATLAGCEAVGLATLNSPNDVHAAINSAKSLTITFDANGGTGAKQTQVTTPGKLVSLKPNVYKKAGSTFLGWSVAKDGNKDYDGLADFVTGTDDVTLWAVWASTSAIESFKLQPGAGNPSAEVLGIIDGANVLLTVPKGTTITGLVATFGLSAGASSKVGVVPQVSGITPNDFAQTVTYIVTGSNGEVQEYKVSVGFEGFILTPATATGGSMAPSAATGSANPIALTATATSGYVFTGWTASPAGNATFTDATSASTTVTLTGDATITPHFSRTYVYSTQGLANIPLIADATVTAKAWGAGGAGTSYGSGGAVGGGGGLAQSTFTALSSQVIHVAVGAGGKRTVTYTGPAMGGTNNGSGTGTLAAGSGGGGSVVALLVGATFNLKAVGGGGGGGAGTGLHGGAGGGVSGGIGDTYGTTPSAGSGGFGGVCVADTNGYKGNDGANMSLTAASFVGLGGKGANASAGSASGGPGGGGGGYGGGAASGFNSVYYAGSGGGGYAVGSGSQSVKGGPWDSVANPTDPAYTASAGAGGLQAGTPGNDGLVVITVTY